MSTRVTRGPAAPLFATLFASQAAVLTLSPILGEVSADLRVAPEVAGQLRSMSGVVAGGVALWLASSRAPRLGLRSMIRLSLALLAVSALISAAAPTFTLLALAQLPLGGGVALAVSGATAAAAEWSTSADRVRTLSWTLAGQPAAWIVGMPVVGLAAMVHWRLSWIALPLVTALVALVAFRARRAPRPEQSQQVRVGLGSLLSHRSTRNWALGEALAYAGWAGTLVYAGGLFVESYGLSVVWTSVVLAAIAGAYTAGNLMTRRWVGSPSPAHMVGLAQASAVMVVVFGAVRPSVAVSATALGVLAFVAGARTLAGSAAGLRCTPDKLGAMSLRAATVQFGYLVGAVVGGAALAIGGYAAVGWAFGGFFASAGLLHAPAALRARRTPSAGDLPLVSSTPDTAELSVVR